MPVKKWYSMKVQGKKAELSIYADVGFGGVTADSFRKELKSYGKLDEIDLRINSYGGEVYDGFAIYNDLKDTGAAITVTVTGIAASIASYIAMAGHEINIHKNAMLMIHNPSVWMAGEAGDLRKEADVLDNMRDSAVKAYLSHAKNLTEAEIIKMMDETTYMTADKALELGFVDKVLDPIEVEEPETNMSIAIPLNYRKKIFTNKLQGSQPPKEDKMAKCKDCGKEIPEGQERCFDCAVKKERAEAQMAERNRISNIQTICRASNLADDVIQKMVDTGKSVDQLSSEIADEIKKMKSLPPAQPQSPAVSLTKDETEKFRAHAVNSLAVMAGIEKDPAVIAETKKDVQINSLHGLMRRDLQRHGVDAIGMNAEQLVTTAIKMAGTGSSDLPAILGDLTNKNMLKKYEEAPVTYNQWCDTMEVPDFKAQKLIKMSNFGDIDDLPEGTPFKNKKLSDKYETVSVDTKGNIFNISRQAMVNDDLRAIVRVPQAMVQAIARRINKDVYDKLTYNSLAGPVMNEDNVALFNSAHSNLTSTSGVPSVSSLAAAERKLMEMPLLKPEPDSVTQYANVQAKYLITGTANKLTVAQLLNTPFDNSKEIAGVNNPYAGGRIIPVFDAYLQALLAAAGKANAWYLAADPMQMEHFVVAFLQGQRTPMLRSEESRVGDAQGFTWEISFDWGIGVPEYRGIIYNDGATGG